MKRRISVYIASNFEMKDQVQKLAKSLTYFGMRITREWWLINTREKYSSLSEDEWYKNEEVRMMHKLNFVAISHSDIFILLSDEQNIQTFIGANIELGYALAKKKVCFSVGKLQKSAMYVPVVKFKNVNELLAKLKSGDWIKK